MTIAIIFIIFSMAVLAFAAFAVRQANLVHDIYVEAMYVPQKDPSHAE